MPTLENTLLGAGIACVIGAIFGGGLKAFGVELPALSSVRRQSILGAFGAILILSSFLGFGKSSPTPPPQPVLPIPCDQWSVAGDWSLSQTPSQITVRLHIIQDGSMLSGTANEGPGDVAITGSMSGNAFTMTAQWRPDPSGSKGQYTAIMDPSGRLTSGLTADLDTGGGREAWTTETTFRCARSHPP